MRFYPYLTLIQGSTDRNVGPQRPSDPFRSTDPCFDFDNVHERNIKYIELDPPKFHQSFSFVHVQFSQAQKFASPGQATLPSQLTDNLSELTNTNFILEGWKRSIIYIYLF